MTKEETAVNISAIKKYIEKTKVPREVLSRYELTIDEVMSFKYYGQELGMLEAISLPSILGFVRAIKRGKYENLKKHEIHARKGIGRGDENLFGVSSQNRAQTIARSFS